MRSPAGCSTARSAAPPHGWDERLLARVAPAINVLWASAVFRAAMPWLELHDAAHAFVTAAIAAVGIIAVFWALWRSVDVVVELTVERSWGADASARSMILVGGNLLKAAVVLVGGVSTAAAFGYPVATVVAGLGIGGIAFAFGAQKTVENLFGSIALATDQPSGSAMSSRSKASRARSSRLAPGPPGCAPPIAPWSRSPMAGWPIRASSRSRPAIACGWRRR